MPFIAVWTTVHERPLLRDQAAPLGGHRLALFSGLGLRFTNGYFL